MSKHKVGAVLLSGVVVSVLGAGVLATVPAGAKGASYVTVKELVSASTFVKKENQTVVSPTGKFVGRINTTTGGVRGKLTLPAATTTIKLAGIGVATATIGIAPTKPVTGKVNFSNFTITTTSTFNLQVRSLAPKGTSINLVGSRCQTATPITLTLTGPFQAIGSSNYTGSFTIPSFTNCQGLALVLTEQASGPDNTFTATFAPA